MELLFNDLSIHGQFHNIPSFRAAIARVMVMREMTQQFGRELHCHKNVAFAQVTSSQIMQQAIQRLGRDERGALTLWLCRRGPFWEEARDHGPDDYLEHNGNIVTNTALGEAAYCCLNEDDSRLVTLIPSSWSFSPVPVTWTPDTGEARNIEVLNYWGAAELKAALEAASEPIESWEQLEMTSNARFPHLTFSACCFDPLQGHPFVSAAADRVLGLLDTLERFKCCFDEDGRRTSEGHRFYQVHFTGKKSRFSDSSATEKRDFRANLTFPHPERDGETLFCPYHGKVPTSQIRLHFSWPISGDPLYVVYVGPKITRR